MSASKSHKKPKNDKKSKNTDKEIKITDEEEKKESKSDNQIESKTDNHVCVGIDFGTTRTAVGACKHESESNIRTVKLGDDTTNIIPSYIFFGDEKEILIGDDARAMQRKEPEKTFYDLKRFQGKTYVHV